MEKILIENIQVHPINALNETLKQMKMLECLSFEKPAFIKFVFKEFFSNCQACIPGKIWKYIRKNFIYVNDSFDETIIAPYILFKSKKGDCDDFALFSKTCLDILGGWYTSYLLLGRQPKQYSHIVCFAHRGNNGFYYNDPVIIDGANEEFNKINNQYIYRKIVI